jgi:hypothetical protein
MLDQPPPCTPFTPLYTPELSHDANSTIVYRDAQPYNGPVPVRAPEYLPLYKIIHVCLMPFKLRFWEIRPEALEALGPDLCKRSINGTFSGLLTP